MRYAILTMGCKLNQYDSAVVSGRLGACYREAESVEEADLIILNTCTVTHKADREARRLIRSLKRRNPRATVVAMGCSARLNKETMTEMAEADRVLAGESDLEGFLLELCGEGTGPCLPRFRDRTRAFLKIQEGCNFPCTYCIVPTVRGPSRSVEPRVVEERFKALLDAGFKEIVLTGVNTGEYGKDLGRARGLEGLLEGLLGMGGRYRIRLNSVEPKAVTPGLVALLREEPALAKHLQVPLQSGSDSVLKAMRRQYSAAFYEELVSMLAGEVPGMGIGADVLAGFPTETAEDFDRTLALLERSPVAFLHAFSFSPRPGTPASRLPGLPPGEVAARTRRLRELGEEKRRAFAEGFLGKKREVLTLGPPEGTTQALADNFLTVTLNEKSPPNVLMVVRLDSVSGTRVSATNEPAARVLPE